MTAILEFRDVARSFGRGGQVLDGVTFSMREGEVVGLLGRNGAGKTTLINIAMGLLHPHAGMVRAFGISPTEDPVAVKKRVGYVSEDQLLPPGMTISDLIAIHRRLFRTWDGALEKQLLERFGLAGNTKKVGKMSKGEARQVALLCAVCHRPELLILDEPAGGLDPAARREFLETSIDLLNREGSAILFSSHQTDDVERLAGRVLLLDRGRMLVDSGMDELLEEHCVAIVPRHAGLEEATVERQPGCLRMRVVYENWHAVFAGAPESVRSQLHASLGIPDIQCVRLPLEELFIELVGGERLARVP
ncbi:MAG TPA: ABC transporter ATP-binding protein [Longimicrobiales bacterium]|nr:ABC transporter ATP-binding protein [Longimicrobiales bacterium]